MLIREINVLSEEERNQAAKLISSGFPHAYPTLKDGHEVIDSITSNGAHCLVALIDDMVVGVVGAIPQYGTTGWELHPLIVHPNQRHMHIGTKLMNAIEEMVRSLGGVMIYLGTDDEFEQTSLSGCDLMTDLYHHIQTMKNIKRHPFEFYQKCGYIIVGVMPDANGLGKPDIMMAKRIVPWK